MPLSRPLRAPTITASPSTIQRMRLGVKPSTLSTAISVRRSRTLMLIAMAITSVMTASKAGTTSHFRIHNRSLYESKKEDEPEEAVSHFTAGDVYRGDDITWLVSLLNAGESGTRSQTSAKFLSAAGC